VIDLKTDNHLSPKIGSFPFRHHKNLTLSFLTTVSVETPVELKHLILKSRN